MFLDYFALVILLIGLTLVFYTFIYIHDLPYKIAKKRHHPHEEAIHVACWLSLFTLHAIWPIVYIWSVTHPKPVDGLVLTPQSAASPTVPAAASAASDVTVRLARLEHRLKIVGILEADSN
jgi:Protein of unknown function (DUF3302)